MLAQFFTIGLIALFCAMVPGPNFAVVSKNAILHSRRAGIFTAFGIGMAVVVHLTYCLLGLAIIISQSILLFNIVKYVGSIYIIYLGATTFLARIGNIDASARDGMQKTRMSNIIALRQGFLCNLLSPKTIFFFLALFTVIIKPDTPFVWELIYAVEMFFIITAWFCTLSFLLSYPRVLAQLNKIEKYIPKALGLFLMGFGVALALVQK